MEFGLNGGIRSSDVSHRHSLTGYVQRGAITPREDLICMQRTLYDALCATIADRKRYDVAHKSYVEVVSTNNGADCEQQETRTQRLPVDCIAHEAHHFFPFFGRKSRS